LNFITLNNEKRKLLTTENEKIYCDMLEYIRISSIMSEQAAEEVLIDVLDHLLDAQAHGKTAYDVFGKDPKAYCDELIDALPRYTFWQALNIFAFVPFVLLAAYFAMEVLLTTAVRLFDPSMDAWLFNPIGLFVSFSSACMVMYVVQRFMKKTAWTKPTFSITLGFSFTVTFLIGLIVAGNISFKMLGIFVFPLPLWISVMASLLFFVCFMYSLKKGRLI
jgi:DNA-binding ferritin-like protein (Dps family)